MSSSLNDIDPERKKRIIATIEETLAEVSRHDDHKLEQIGPCVYCIDCDKRLYQGELKK